MRTNKFLVTITHDPQDKEELLHLIPGPPTIHTDTLIQYWIEATDKATIFNEMKEDFQDAGKEALFGRIINIDIKDISEAGYVKHDKASV